ncbi:type 1 glutamine amidotransferase [Pseudorhodobacter ferrugineus]|uniref:type 1 glutamine amidotransferase n=1 Tax=Pseudorhodobacter ferrugineus TaxID=77008 RepID=UPI000402EEB9|nr:type 1 glutamine amidotransferase [Pseudorhodobacter ferrugineus]
MRVAIVENTGGTQHGQVGVALAEAGAIIDQYRPYLGQALPDRFDGVDALVVFGGEQCALADATHPYLRHLAGLMQQMVAADKAVLGICLGSQLMARGFGAKNHIGTAPEFGWVQIAPSDAAAKDPVLSGLAGGFTAFQWHSDTFDLPNGAIHLASSASVQNQAFRVGRAGYATQFHFEANQQVVASWINRFPSQIESMASDWIAQHEKHAALSGAAADAAGLAIARAFVAQIR